MEFYDGDQTFTAWMTATQSRVEGEYDGVKSVMITTPEGMYMMNEDDSIDCDWYFFEVADDPTMEAPDFDEDFTIEELEAEYTDDHISMDCSAAKAPTGAFDTPGKVCSEEEMMEAMMGDIDLGDYDLPDDFDMDDFE